MRSVLLIPGVFYIFGLSLALTLVHRPTVAEVASFNFCTRNHCENCSGAEVLECSKDAIVDRCGDLCGCCQACVRFREQGESCGSQLAVRWSKNVHFSRPPVTILATTKCNKNLICENFICRQFNDTAIRKIIDEESFELRSKSISPKTATTESYSNEISARKMKLEMKKGRTIFNRSAPQLINLSVAAGELQLIYGHEAFGDFCILIGSIGKSLRDSILESPEIGVIHESLKKVLLAECTRMKLNTEKSRAWFWTFFKIGKTLKNKNSNSNDFIAPTLPSKISNAGTPSKKLRKKRQLDIKKLTNAKMDDSTQSDRQEISTNDDKIYPGTSVYDVINKTPREIENFERWLSTQTMKGNFNARPLTNDERESEINIHITGVPGSTNLSLEVDQVQKNTDQDKIDIQPNSNDDIISDANYHVVTTQNPKIENPLTSNTSKIFQHVENPDISGSASVAEEIKFSNNDFEFVFPEDPVILDNKSNADDVNETAEFGVQLDRIESRAIVIENVVNSIMKKIDAKVGCNDTDYIERLDSIDGIGDHFEENPFTNTMFQARETANPKYKNPVDLRQFSIEERTTNIPENIIENARVNNFHPKRLSQQWRTSEVNLWDDKKASNPRRLHRSEEHRQVGGSRWPNRRREYLSRKPKNSMESLRNDPEKRNFPIFLSNEGSRRPNLHHRRKDSKIVQGRKSDLEVNSNSPMERSAWPLNFYRHQALPASLGIRRIESGVSGPSLRTDIPVVEESIIFLETQMPRSMRARHTSNGDRLGAKPIKWITKYDDDWNSRGDTYLSDLFAREENSEIDPSKPRLPESVASPVERTGTNENHQEIPDDDNYWLLPGDLDYERTDPKIEKDSKVDDSDMITSFNPDQNGSSNLSLNRTKRDTSFSSSTEKINIMENSRPRKILRPKRQEIFSNYKNSDVHLKRSSIPGRSKRSVRMVDWLRAAQDYQERLRQLRAAALKTWLASREVISDANLTSVMLFTRENEPEVQGVPSFQENFEDLSNVEDYPADFNDAIADSSKTLRDILVDQSFSNDRRANDSVDQQFIRVSSSSVPRKLTIMTNGNSTIRIEDVADDNDKVSRHEDQMAQGSLAEEVVHELPITASDTDYFDHIYESFDTDDGDFNYDDPHLTSGWVDHYNPIDSPIKKDQEDRSPGSSYEKEQSQFLTRFKRNSPLVLFKVNSNPKKEVLIWPSNWKDLINRHLKQNRSTNEPTKTMKRKNYLASRKIVSMPSGFEMSEKNDGEY